MCIMIDLNANFTTLKMLFQRHEILCLKFCSLARSFPEWLIVSGPEMYDNTGCSLYPQIWRQLIIPKWIDYIFTTVASMKESSWEPAAI